MQRLVIPLIFGLAGLAVLISLGNWQMRRLEWKQELLSKIEARIAATPVTLPDDPNQGRDDLLAVTLTGQVDQSQPLRVLVSQKQIGPGYRLISAFETEQGRLLLDRGFIRTSDPLPQAPKGLVQVLGNLRWPDDRNSSTPENDSAGNIWFARDLLPMAKALNTRPILVVNRQMSPAEQYVQPIPVGTGNIPNDHLQYAVTWYGLALVWGAMTLYFLWRNRRPETKA